MAVVLSIINMKGGVGKTTLSVGIADYLASIYKRVLLIDADPQFNATQTMIDCYLEDEDGKIYLSKIKPQGKTIYTLFKERDSMLEYAVNMSSNNIITHLTKNLDIVCGDLDLFLAKSEHSSITRIKNFIEDKHLKDEYDYIIIDCPPTITTYSHSALYASDFYLIPNRIDKYSILGIDSLMKTIDKLIMDERINLYCIGLVYTMVDKTASPKKQAKLKIEFESQIPKDRVDIFDSVYHYSGTAIYGSKGSLPTRYTSTREDIEAITQELMNKINEHNRSEQLC